MILYGQVNNNNKKNFLDWLGNSCDFPTRVG